MKPTTQRALTYVGIAFLLPWSEKVVPVLQDGSWPTPQACVSAAILGLASALLAYRAFIDGSVERAKNEETTFITKP